ncbi:TPA: DMT family transporter, partial [Candidatus Micrarchaeota archaeon]|nr:DMT family transporter [Candidatus Micrarchaeota archaeon]
FGSVLGKLLSFEGFSLVWAICISYLIAGLVLFAYARFKKIRHDGFFHDPHFYGLCFGTALLSTFAIYAYTSMTLGTYSFIGALSIPLAPAAAWLFLKETVSWRTGAAVVAAIAGIVLVSKASTVHPLAMTFALLSVACIVAVYLFARCLRSEFNELMVAFVFLGASAILFPIALVLEPFPSFTPYLAVLVLGLAFFDLVLGDNLRNYALSKAPIRVVSMIRLCAPFIYSIVGFVAFGEVVSSKVVLGGAVTVFAAGLAISEFNHPHRAKHRHPHFNRHPLK